MLQQTQVKTVLPYWQRWMRTVPTIRALARAKPEELHKLWEGLGYYTRVRNMQNAARLIIENHGGLFPRQFEDVLELPGIGRYTAGAICSIAFGEPKPVLDGNVIRVLTRVFGIDGDPKEKKVNASLWQLSEDLVRHAGGCQGRARVLTPFLQEAPRLERKSNGSLRDPPTRAEANIEHPASSFNQALMELGALVCTPRHPRCESCPVASLCAAFQENRVDELPALKPRPAASLRRFAAFVVERRGRILVRQRSAGVLNAHLWEFPNIELKRHRTDMRTSIRELLGENPRTLQRLCAIKHTITRYRITLDAYSVTGVGRIARRGGFSWLSRGELKHRAFASAHGKILSRWIDGMLVDR